MFIMRKNNLVKIFTLSLVYLLASCNSSSTSGVIPFDIGENIKVDGYKLTQAVVLSRHNIRSPLSEPGSILDRLTPHSWFNWTSKAGELSLKGGSLETQMGHYFRKWLEDMKLFPLNYQPSGEEVRIYANAKQRTIATANYFSTALFPSTNIDVETKVPYDTMDPVFNPQITYLSDSYVEATIEEIFDLYSDDIEELKDEYNLLEDVLSFKESEAYLSGEFKEFKTDDTEISYDIGEEPVVGGSLGVGVLPSDALTLQYYEEMDNYKAGFNHYLSYEEWQDITRIKDTYMKVKFLSPLVSLMVAHPLLEEIESELTNSNRKFSFLCGHDSNLGTLLTSLDVKEYELIGSIESDTPIGSKIVFSTFTDEEEKEYIRVDLVYQNVDYLRNVTLLDLNTHPSVTPLYFNGLTINDDGLYDKDEFITRLHNSVNEYDNIKARYPD